MSRTKAAHFPSITTTIVLTLLFALLILIATPLQAYAKEAFIAPPTSAPTTPPPTTAPVIIFPTPTNSLFFPTPTPIPNFPTPTNTPSIPPTPTNTPPVLPTATNTPPVLPTPTNTPPVLPTPLSAVVIIKSEEKGTSSCTFKFIGDNAETCSGYSAYPCTCTINCPSCLTEEDTCTGLSVNTINAICGNSGWKEADRFAKWHFYTVVKRIRQYLKY